MQRLLGMTLFSSCSTSWRKISSSFAFLFCDCFLTLCIYSHASLHYFSQSFLLSHAVSTLCIFLILYCHDSLTTILVALVLLFLHVLDTFLSSAFLPVLNVSYTCCRPSSSCFMSGFSSMTSQHLSHKLHTWLCNLHTRFSSDFSGGVTYLMA